MLLIVTFSATVHWEPGYCAT